jgi:small-conductance mechanosensitive channel
VTATVIEQAGDQLGSALPRVAAALVLLVAGLLVAVLVGRLVRRALTRLGLDRATERWRLPEILERAGLGRSLARLVGIAVRLSLAAIVIFAALSLLGLEFLSQSLNEAVLFIPRLIIALILLLAGVVLAALARDWVERGSIQMDLPIALGPLVQGVVVVLFGLTAANELGIAIAPLLTILLIALLAVVATLAIAFGLGGRELARSLSAARYARSDFAVGQTIRVDDLRGTIVKIDSAATTLRAGEETVRVPNSVLVERIVVLEADEV